VALEPEFWSALERIAAARGQPVSALLTAVDAARAPGRPLASALRLLVLHELQRLAQPGAIGAARDVTPPQNDPRD
jgi:predicted DNA-binding ribbon-helix-helix protein